MKDQSKQREAKRRYYKLNREAVIARAAANNVKQRQQIRKIIAEYLEGHPCIDCSERDPIVLEFDHVRGVKTFNIGNAARKGFSVKNLMAEIAKCEIRCANCHRRKTYRERQPGSIPAPATNSFRAFDPRGAASHLGSLPAGGKFQRLANGAVRREIGE